MKRILSLALTVVLLLGLIPAGAIALPAEAVEWYDIVYKKGSDYVQYQTPWYFYTVKDGEVSFGPDWFPNSTYFEIPSTLRGYPVTSISRFNSTDLEELVIPDSVTQISGRAFSGCTNLKTVTIGTGVKTMPASTFYNCSAITTVNYNAVDCYTPYDTDDDGKTIYLFSGCPALKTLNIGENVKTIPECFLSHNTSVTTVKLNKNIERIGRCAFDACTALTTVTMPNTVREIAEYAFRDCSNLKSINISTNLQSLGESAFNSCSSLSKITLPDTLQVIESHTFYNCKSLATLTLPDSLQTIGWCAFQGCASLNEISIPNSVWKIESSAFENTGYYLNDANWENNSLYIGSYLIEAHAANNSGSLIVKDGTRYIANNAAEMASLKSVTLPNGLLGIGNYAFSACSSLASINIPDSVNYIGIDIVRMTAFIKNTANWENGALYIGRHLVAVDPQTVNGEYAVKADTLSVAGATFTGCENLTSVTLPSGITKIANNTFYRCSSLTSVTIPNGVSLIDRNAFSGCSSLTSLSIPSSVQAIVDYAFQSCSSLTSIILPDTLQWIRPYTFSGCTALTTVTIPATVQQVMECAFKNCTALQTVYYRGTAATRADILINDDNEPLTEATWEYIGGGHVYSNANDNICNICGEDKSLPYYTYTVTDGEATVTDVKVAITGDVVIPDTLGGAPVTVLAKDAFRDCANVTSVTIPATVTSMGTSVFKGCTALTTVYYNAVDCTAAGSSAYPVFSGCAALDTVHIGDGVTRIPAQIFRGLTALKTVFLAKSVTTIEKNAFYQDSALTVVRYGGTSADRKLISVASYNTALTNAKWVYTACEHTYDNACDKNCNTCGKERKTERHVWDDGVVLEEATAAKTGSKQFTCTVCGSTAVVETTLGTVEDGVYYYDGEKTANAGLVMVDGAYYYVSAGGKVKTGRYAISNVNGTDVERGIYYFFEDGTMNTEEGVYDGYYYNERGKSEAYAGLVEWSGSKYYVSDGGRVKTGRYFISKLNGIVPKKRAYTFYDDGCMLEETRIYEADGYYYEEGIRVPYAGLVEYEGHFYYVADNGAYVTGKRQNVSNVGYTDKSTGYYYFDENGYMLMNAIVDNRYYGKDGLAPYAVGVVKVGNYYYYVNGTHGALRTSATFTVSAAKTNGLIAAGKYTADANGRLTAA